MSEVHAAFGLLQLRHLPAALEKRARIARAELEREQAADLEQVSYNDNQDFNLWLDESYPYEGKLNYSFALFSLYYEDYLVRLEEFRDSANEEDE